MSVNEIRTSVLLVQDKVAAALTQAAQGFLAIQAELDIALTLLGPAPFYTSCSDRVVRPKPVPVVLGPAGFNFTDKAYGSAMWRVTDPNTVGGAASSVRVASNAALSAWNTDSSKVFGMGEGGQTVFFGFDGKAVTHLADVAIHSQIEPCFSFVDPAIVYGTESRRIRRYNILTNVATDVVDLDVLYASHNPQGYMGGLLVADNDVLVAFFGGGGQDQHHLVHHSTAGLLDTLTLPVPFLIHSLQVERTGRYLMLAPRQQDIAAAGQIVVWDTQAHTYAKIPTLQGGHGTTGYGCWVNQDCCSGSAAWDAYQWQYRRLDTPGTTQNLIVSPMPKLVAGADHTSWRHARPDRLVPVVSSVYRYGTPADVCPWREWDDEIIAVATDSSGVVYRFAHHQSVYDGNFWAQPIANVNPTGHFAVFTSNWGVPGGRQDMFLVNLQ